MTCDLAQSFLDAYVDRELDTAESVNVEEHLRTCDACSRLHARMEALRSVIRKEAPRYRAPDGLRERIQTDLRGRTGSPVPEVKRTFDWRWAAMAASVLVAAIALWQMQVFSHSRQESLIAREIVSGHVRSL